MGGDGRVTHVTSTRQRPAAGALSTGAFALVLAALVLSLAFVAAPAVAAGTPKATVEASDVTASTAYLRGYISAGYDVAAETTETKWRMEYSTVGASGPWTEVPGGSGTISTAEANSSLSLEFGVHFTGLSAATKYYVRASAVSEEGSAESIVSSFSTASPPKATTFATHTLDGETIRALGFVNADGSTPTNELQTVTVGGGATGGTFKLCLEGHCTGAAGTGTITEGSTQITDLETSSGVFAYDEPVFGVGIPNGSFIEGKGTGAGGLPRLGLNQAATESRAGVALSAELAFIPHETSDEQNETSRIGDALDELPDIGGVSGTSNIFVRPGPAPDSYAVEFAGELAGRNLPQMTAEASGLTPSGTVTVATIEAGAPFPIHYHFEYVSQEQFELGGFAKAAASPEVSGSGIVGQDLPGLRAGETYHYRIVAISPAGTSTGSEQALTVPVPAPAAAPAPCPNEALRSGLSATLPDCRAYEQVTPAEKDGTEDIFHYGGALEAGPEIAEDGEHLMLHTVGVHWGDSSDPRQSSYFFERAPNGWQMTSARPAGEASPYAYLPVVFNANLTEIGVEIGWETTNLSHSPDLEFDVGPPGGPYTTVATIPRAEVNIDNAPGWAAESADGGKFILQTEDRKLAGRNTGTTAGNDLYEYSEGRLRQMNVLTDGEKISTCGASMAQFRDEHSKPITPNGSRVFFTDNCTHDLYMRVNGEETRDIGEYEPRAINQEGTKLLLEQGSGKEYGLFTYDTESGVATKLFSLGSPIGAEISEDFTTLYLSSGEPLTSEAPPATGTSDGVYRYDLATKEFHFVVQAVATGRGEVILAVSPDGRYVYIKGRSILGVGPAYARYDSAEKMVECITCASPFRPEGSSVADESTQGNVEESADGNFAFFDTTAALLPQDVDGEVAPEAGEDAEHESGQYSVSSDVYEWRNNGIDGCSHVQGCLSLITTGEGGYINILFGQGMVPSTNDIFFGTHESLVPQDADTAGDLYDARVDGGYPAPPPRPTECEGDACSTPFAPPNDLTPASITFHGPGDLTAEEQAPVVVRAKPKPKEKVEPKGKRRKSRKKAKKSDHRKGR